jgi:hypothetical protein
MTGFARGATLPRMSRTIRFPLVRCRECDSPLLQPLAVTAAIDGLCLVSRYCPDCARRDIVVADEIAAQAWFRRERRMTAWITLCADALATELASATAPRPLEA